MKLEPSTIKNMPPCLKFNLPDTEPEDGYSSQYFLWVGREKDGIEPPPEDQFLWGLWHEGEWWIVDDNFVIPIADYSWEEYPGAKREVVPFEKLSETNYFTLKGWAAVRSGRCKELC